MEASITTVNKEKKIYFNHSFDKKRLKALISWIFKQSGEAEALKVVDLLKETGFRYATKAGISIGLHDLTTPIQKSWLISESQLAISTTDRDFSCAKITATERSQRIIDTWHRASESLSKQVVDYFGIYDRFNPVYIMALSGARGNFSQVRQLIGMRGLMADQQGKIVSFPIRSNLREGLTLTEYFISCSGARKGLVDTALRTADTGYLTRRLVDVSHHVVVKRIRCNTNRGIVFKSLQSYNKIALSLKERLVGRVLAENIFQPSQKLLAKKDREISLKLSLKITEIRDKVYLRSPLTCGFTHSVCQLCYGWSISQGTLVALGDAVGVIAAQSIGEPGTQLTMRTFHTGGVFSGDLLQEIRAPHAGKVEFSKAFQGLLIRTAHGRIAFLSKTEGHIVVSYDQKMKLPKENKEKKTFYKKNIEAFTRDLTENVKKELSSTTIPIPPFTMLFIRQGEKVEKNQLLAEFSIRTKEGNQPIKTQQTIFALLSGRVIEDCSGKVYTKTIKESALSFDALRDKKTPFIPCKTSYRSSLKASQTNCKSIPVRSALNSHAVCTPLPYAVLCSCTKRMPSLLLTNRRFVCMDSHYKSKSKSSYKYLYKYKHAQARTNQRFVCKALREDLYKERRKQLTSQRETLVLSLSALALGVRPNTAEHAKSKASTFLHTNRRFVSRSIDSRARTRIKSTILTCKEKICKKILSCKAKGGWSQNQRFDARTRTRGVRTCTCNAIVKSMIYSGSLVKPFFSQEAGFKDLKRNVRPSVANKSKALIGGRLFKNSCSSICKAKLLSSYKSEDLENDSFRFIEPITSGRLGFLKILATRVGANLDYISPINSFNAYFIKRSKIYTLMQGSETKFCAHALQIEESIRSKASYAFAVSHTSRNLSSYKSTYKCEPLSCAYAHQIADFDLYAERTKLCFVRKKKESYSQSFALASRFLRTDKRTCTPICKRNKKICTVAALQFAFSNYLHPEAIKENRFFLQTIAEYGDIVDETYKKTPLF